MESRAFITIAEKNMKHILPVENIMRMKAARVYTIFYAKDGKQYVCCKRLGEVLKELEQGMFFRIHKSHIINLREIKVYQHAKTGQVIMKDNTVISVATRRKKELLRVLEKLR